MPLILTFKDPGKITIPLPDIYSARNDLFNAYHFICLPRCGIFISLGLSVWAKGRCCCGCNWTERLLWF